ncbi:hypothetical protein P168DRAFT_293876 [Aspergillus campestris IBT 28561]|uniref:Uncharacterized protein n=1 Tax=Aspergillus campestris (strain IBT 28561) TaxID=1392248 RepID=A0A2I1CPZ9_ASPC2|nr:uncharacterized protein P168DRAFT_293958 [Aspergillus campestris IBT 28561]XP_024688440.1 uncharacterized protein P168DRAFT_293876 [Aspergillus campestris IBT 28561]PKX99702.1 hypothetical protein P168DRAFT_293958 [Aspergillus campestris IBT 28561]PKX99845.1 hypothetical protein P168DRAFT_293876 [Aspergillus campestris IBT 28561]
MRCEVHRTVEYMDIGNCTAELTVILPLDCQRADCVVESYTSQLLFKPPKQTGRPRIRFLCIQCDVCVSNAGWLYNDWGGI